MGGLSNVTLLGLTLTDATRDRGTLDQIIKNIIALREAEDVLGL